VAVSFLPNLEFNERQTVVITGDWGNRLQPDEPGALYPVSVSIVNDGTPLQLFTSAGLTSAVGYTVVSMNPYVVGNGPTQIEFFKDMPMNPVDREKFQAFGYPSGDSYNMYIDSALKNGVS
jgi:hypothetical protein